jgi:hypothetical protein
MDPVIVLSILSAVAAAVWSVWTWSAEQQQHRELKRDQEAALYVNPFLLVLHECQRRLHGILQGHDLVLFKQVYPERDASGSPAAIEILYLFGQVFGWMFPIFRYGPYTNDPSVIALLVELATTFDRRDRFADDAFRFSIAEQAALGQAVLRRYGEGAPGLPEFEAISLFDFERDLRDAQSARAPLYQSRAIRRALEAIDRAERVEELEGRARLAAVQHVLLRLLQHLEHGEGFSLSLATTPNAVRSQTAAVSAPVHTGAPTILHRTRGRIRLGIPRLRRDAAYAERLQALLRTWNDVEDVSINTGVASVTIWYRATVPDEELQGRVLEAMERASHQDGITEHAAPL